ncbi:HAD-IA family hydrolase [Candidatus Micrarchaeota archaeon]|nr:HAD-IA family hydrolase [Candidatus Micrarchaeota archaeon]
MSSFKALLFDLDNTLLDFLSFKIETAKAAAKEMVRNGLPCTELAAYGKIFSVYEEKGIEYQKTFHDVIVPFGLDANASERIQQAAILAYLKKKFEILRPYTSVRSTLIRLHTRYSLGIVTDAPRNKAWQRLILSGLEREFDFVITHDDTLNKKPHPSPFTLALSKLECLPSSVLFVGDNLERDILGAKNSGMVTCWAKYGSNRKAKHDSISPDFEIEKFEDLLKIVQF